MARAKIEKHVFPGVRGVAKKDIKINKITIIPKGSKIIIQPLDNPKKKGELRYKITTFEHDNSGANSELPESQRDIKPGNSYEVQIAKPSEYFKFEEHYKLSKQPLFPTEKSPSLEEIQQSQIPDCFLLAAIQSVLNHPQGANYIRGMMRDNGNGTTTVRFFNPHNGSPHDICVVNAVLVNEKQESLNDHKALWVHVLEKAYAAFGKRVEGAVDSSASSVFSGGGQMYFAKTILSGLKEEKTIHLEKAEPSWLFTQKDIACLTPVFEMSSLLGEEKTKEIIKQTFYAKLNYFAAVIRQDYLNKQELFLEEEIEEKAYREMMAYYHFYVANSQAIDSIVQKNPPRLLDELVTFAGCSNSDVTQTLTKAINYELVPNEKQIVRGNVPPFSGVYTQAQINCFTAMDEALSKGKLVTAATPQKFDNPVPGLRNKHAYTVLNVFKRKETIIDKRTGLEEKSKMVYYVRLRNPWGNTGRVYEQQEGTFKYAPKEDKKADIFEIELSDFYNNYQYVSISHSANEQFAFHNKRLQLQERIAKWKSITIETSLGELIQFKEGFEFFEKELVDLERLHLQSIPDNEQVIISDIFAFSEEDCNEEEKKSKIINLLSSGSISPPFYTGAEEIKYQHLYHLLKLKWLESQQNLDTEAINLLKKEIIKNLPYDFCMQLQKEKQKYDFLVQVNGNICAQEIAKLKIQIGEFQKQLNHNGINENNFQIGANILAQIYKSYTRILIKKSMLANFDVNFQDEDIIYLQDHINQISKILKASVPLANLKNALDNQIDTVVSKAMEAEKESLPKDELIRIKQMANLAKVSIKASPEISRRAKQLQDSDDSILQELGLEMDYLYDLWNSFVEALTAFKDMIVNFFSNCFAASSNSVSPEDENAYLLNPYQKQGYALVSSSDKDDEYFNLSNVSSNCS